MSIRIQNIQKRFGNFIALDNVTLDFPSGELIALLGPSGCGKTTLLRIIAGLEIADSGKIFLNDEFASEVHARKRRVGFIFQHYALFRHMTVFDNIAFGLRVKSRKMRLVEAEIRHRVYELLDLIQLNSLADRYPTELSGGQRQRIALARALAVEPRILLLDEPFGALDAKVRKGLRRWLKKLHDELHITSILVTHDQEEALEISDRIVLMNQGRVEQVGTPEQLYHQPASPFVYDFLGDFNLFHGRIHGDQLHMGHASFSLNNNSLAQGTETIGFVRPHELTIITEQCVQGSIAAQINRILTLGSKSYIKLSSIDTNKEAHYDVELSKQEIVALQLREGQKVWLKPNQIHFFQSDAKTQNYLAELLTTQKDFS